MDRVNRGTISGVMLAACLGLVWLTSYQPIILEFDVAVCAVGVLNDLVNNLGKSLFRDGIIVAFAVASHFYHAGQSQQAEMMADGRLGMTQTVAKLHNV